MMGIVSPPSRDARSDARQLCISRTPRHLLVCLGSQQNDPTGWTRDLLEGNCSGSVWRIDLRSRKASCLADGLAWPNGVIVGTRGRTVIAEAWRHQLIEIRGGKPKPILSEIPGYPGRIAHRQDGAATGFRYSRLARSWSSSFCASRASGSA